MRIGLHSGPVVVGAIGDDLRMDYTAQGDTSNLAARMEGSAEPGGILVSDHTYRLAKVFFEFAHREPIRVKGKKDLQTVFEVIREGRAETRMEASIIRGLTRFVGRRKELELLLEAYLKASEGSGQVVGIVGEAGVGKSRLLLEFTRLLPAGEYTFLTGQCLQFGRNMPYLPLLSILRVYFGLKDVSQERLARQRMRDTLLNLDPQLLTYLPSFHSLLSLTVEDRRYRHMDPKSKRDLDVEALHSLFVRESRHRPLVLVMEDLHWMDKTSDQFLDLFIGNLVGVPILLLLLYRPEYNHPWGSKSYYQQIGLDQLPALESEALVSAILVGGRVAPELQDLILDRAAGNPLYMEEFTRNLVEKGAIFCEADRYMLRPGVAEIQVPDTIQGIITARLDRLTENLKSTVQVAAVIGRDFAYRILQSVMGLREELRASLINLQGLELIYEKTLFPELEYIFKHAMTQEVAYNSLLVKNRERIHEQIGRSIEELYADRLEEFTIMLAHHYGHSRNPEKGYAYLTRAGLQAQAAFANEEALNYFRKAWSLIDKMTDPELQAARRIETGVWMAEVLEPLGRFPDALEVLTAVTESEDRGKAGPRLARAYFCLGNNHSNLGQWTLARGHLSSAIDLAQITNDQFVLGAAYHYLGQLDFFSGFIPASIKNLEKAAAIFEALDNPFWLSWTYSWLANVISNTFYRFTALTVIRKAEYWTQLSGNKRAAVIIHFAWFSYRIYMGDVEKALEQAEQAAAAAQKANDYIMFGSSFSFQSLAHCRLGAFDVGLEKAEMSICQLEKIGFKLFLAIGLIERGKALMGLGRLNDAGQSIARGMVIARELDLGWGQLSGFAVEAQIQSRQNVLDREAVLKALGQAVKFLMRSRSWGYLLEHCLVRADVYLVMGEKPRAAKEISRARRIYARMEIPEGTPELHSLEVRMEKLSVNGG